MSTAPIVIHVCPLIPLKDKTEYGKHPGSLEYGTFRHKVVGSYFKCSTSPRLELRLDMDEVEGDKDIIMAARMDIHPSKCVLCYLPNDAQGDPIPLSSLQEFL
ncbi:MAG: hypothetical protein CMI56_00795, partial [Parcubacteria group bacterium]|nr:hypothetical protein [Parcubacteria group bacterium]